MMGFVRPELLKVLTLDEALECKWPLDRVAVFLADRAEQVDVSVLRNIGVGAFITSSPFAEASRNGPPVIHSLRNPAVMAPGDVIQIVPGREHIRVLYRRSATSNFLFLTEQCNSNCIMCSQPPRAVDDAWRIAEIERTIPLIDRDIAFLGMTGGEPTLLRDRLANIIELCSAHLPNTQLHILTNGRAFESAEFVAQFAYGIGRVTWAIPLYADIASRHDYVVQVRGAFNATIEGIYNLVERGHRLEIRFVIHAQTLPRMSAFAEFVYRNLPFASHLAFMGLEPMGYAKVNRDLLWVDPIDYAEELARATYFLHDRGFNVSIYNVPLCVLTEAARKLAKRSISEWKQTFPPECNGCTLRDECSGFFASAGPSWRSKVIKPFRGGAHVDAAVV